MQDRAALVQLLRDRSPFAGLEERELKTLAYLLRPSVAEDGAELFREGDAAQDAFIVVEGEVEIVNEVAEGVRHVRRKLGPGELFGELALFGGGRRLAGAVARGRTVLGAVAYDDFVEAVRAHPPVALALLRLQASRFAALEREHRELLARAR